MVPVKCTIPWDVKLRSLIDVHRRFGGTYSLHLQQRRASQTTSMKEAEIRSVCLSFTWRWGQNVPLKYRWAFTTLNGITVRFLFKRILMSQIWLHNTVREKYCHLPPPCPVPPALLRHCYATMLYGYCRNHEVFVYEIHILLQNEVNNERTFSWFSLNHRPLYVSLSLSLPSFYELHIFFSTPQMAWNLHSVTVLSFKICIVFHFLKTWTITSCLWGHYGET